MPGISGGLPPAVDDQANLSTSIPAGRAIFIGTLSRQPRPENKQSSMS